MFCSFDLLLRMKLWFSLFQHQPMKDSFAAINNLNDIELDEIVTESFSEITEEITDNYDEMSTTHYEV